MSVWNPKANEIFVTAIDIVDDGERSRFVDGACQADAALRADVDNLLRAHAAAGNFLETAIVNSACLLAEPNESEIAETPGKMIGPYKLLEQIGEGGFGFVYMAEQLSPVRRRVALKIIKPGMDSRKVIARFEAERQALAMMDHPHIARAFDAGETDTGRPYFVMELVRGVPITQFCDESTASVRQRLELFVQVCQAVHHAHQKGIIHRDIKPSNVLVALHDTCPVPKVIDFGVAKAIHQPLTERTLFTLFSEMIGTPLYMSPEQADLSGLDVDTRSDVYSLGVLLYELLTGATPFDQARLTSAPFLEIRRIIREEDPPKPSTRVSTMGARCTTVASARQADPRRLGQLVRGDLDWIVMKALEKDRTRRYDSASALAADIQRHMANLPIEAHSPSALHRARKFIRRNKAAFTTVALVLLALLAGTVVSTVQAIRATHAEELANERLEKELAANEEAATNFRLARQSVDDSFTLVSESKLFDVPGMQPLRKQLLEASLRYHLGFVDKSGDDPQVRAEFASTLLRVSQVYMQNDLTDDAVHTLDRGLGIVNDLRREQTPIDGFPQNLAGLRKEGRVLHFFARWPIDFQEALRVYGNAVATWEQLARENSTVVGFQSDLASFWWQLGDQQVCNGQREEAVRSFHNARAIWERLAREHPREPEYQAGLATSLEYLGIQPIKFIARDEKEAALRQAVEIREQLVANFPDIPEHRANLANCFRRLASTLRASNRPADAEATFRRSIAEWEALSVKFPLVPGFLNQVAVTHNELGTFLRTAGRIDDAEKSLRLAVDHRARLVSEFFNGEGGHIVEWSVSVCHLADLLNDTGRQPEAEELFRKTIAQFEARLKTPVDEQDFRRELARMRNRFGLLLTSKGELVEAESQHREAATIYEQLAQTAESNDNPWHGRARMWKDHGESVYQLANVLSRSGHPEKAEELHRETIARFETLLKQFPDSVDYRVALCRQHNCLGLILSKRDRPAESEREHRRALELFESVPVAAGDREKAHREERMRTHKSLGVLYDRTGRLTDAETHLRAAVAEADVVLNKFPTDGHVRSLSDLCVKLTRAQFHLGRSKDALASFQKLLALGRTEQAQQLLDQLRREVNASPGGDKGKADEFFAEASTLMSAAKPNPTEARRTEQADDA